MAKPKTSAVSSHATQNALVGTNTLGALVAWNQINPPQFYARQPVFIYSKRVSRRGLASSCILNPLLVDRKWGI